MTTAIATKESGAQSLEKVLIGGDLAALSPQERIMYYKQTCESLGLNPLTKPFEYIKLNGKLTLYARKDATDQLRQLHGVSIEKPEIQQIDNLIIVTVSARDKNGRSDSDIGVVGKNDMNGNAANALMKAVTKAKRRVTLSICGLGMLDETEVETIPTAAPAEIEPVMSPEDEAAIISLRQQMNELLDKSGVTDTKKQAGLAKFDSFRRINEMEDAVAVMRRKVEKAERETLSQEIYEGLAAQKWDEAQLETYLGGFGVQGLDDATIEQIKTIHADMTDAKMI